MKKYFQIGLLTIASIYSLFVVFNKFSFLGLAYDESLFINAAVLRSENTFIARHFRGIPLMLMSYIGALKSWIYIPIFKIFGVNIYSVRLPMVILMYVNFYLIFILSSKYFNKLISICLILLVLTDFSFINLHKIDHGPTAIETFLKLITLIFILKKQSFKNSLVIFLFLFLGLFNKLNFIWFINAVFGTYLLLEIFFSKKQIGYRFKSISNLFIFNCLLYLFLILYFFFILKIGNISPNKPLNISDVVNLFEFKIAITISSIFNYQYEYLLGWLFGFPKYFLTEKVILTLIIIGNVVLFFQYHNQIISKHFKLLLFTFLILIQFFLTKEATNIWHVLMIYPFIQLVILSTIYIFSDFYFKSNKIILYSVTFLWCMHNLFRYYQLEKNINKNCNYWLYEPSINKVIAEIERRPEQNVINLGHGIHTQILALVKSEKNFLEIIANPLKQNSDNLMSFDSVFFREFENTICIENLNNDLAKKRIDFRNFKNSITKKGMQLKLISSIKDACGNGYCNIYKLGKISQ